MRCRDGENCADEAREAERASGKRGEIIPLELGEEAACGDAGGEREVDEMENQKGDQCRGEKAQLRVNRKIAVLKEGKVGLGPFRSPTGRRTRH